MLQRLVYCVYRNPSISTVNTFQTSVVLREFRAKRGQKTIVIQVMRENQTISLDFCPDLYHVIILSKIIIK